jgi:hypothetical protein
MEIATLHGIVTRLSPLRRTRDRRALLVFDVRCRTRRGAGEAVRVKVRGNQAGRLARVLCIGVEVRVIGEEHVERHIRASIVEPASRPVRLRLAPKTDETGGQALGGGLSTAAEGRSVELSTGPWEGRTDEPRSTR